MNPYVFLSVLDLLDLESVVIFPRWQQEQKLVHQSQKGVSNCSDREGDSKHEDVRSSSKGTNKAQRTLAVRL